PDEALKVYEDALAVYKEIHARRDVLETELSIGNVYFDKQDLNEAIRHYRLALGMGKAIGDSLSLGLSYLTIGNALLELKKYDQAKNYLDSALVVSQKKKLASFAMDSYHLLSVLYEEDKKPVVSKRMLDMKAVGRVIRPEKQPSARSDNRKMRWSGRLNRGELSNTASSRFQI